MVKLVLRNFGRNKKRTALTLASVSLAVLLLCLLMALLLSFTQAAEASAENRVVVRSAISLTFSLPESYWPRLQRLEHVQAVTALNWFGGIYIDQRIENFFAQFASDPATIWQVFYRLRMSDQEKEAWADERTAFIAGKALAEQHGWKIGDQIFIKGEIYPIDLNLTLRGIFTDTAEPPDERQIFFHRRYFEEALGNPGEVGLYWLKVDAAEHVPAVIAAAEAMFAQSDARVKAETEKAFQLSFVEMLGNIRLLFGSIGLAIVISIFFMTANTMAMAARERTTEVAVLKTLGFRSHHVLGVVLSEALLLGALGGFVGTGLAIALVKGTATVAAQVFPLFGTLRVTPGTALAACAIGVAIGLLSGLLPAWNAARLRVVDGLRRVA